MQKDDSITSAGTEADSGQNDKDIFVSQHGRKPNVSGLPSLSAQELTDYIFRTFTVPVKSINYHLTIA